MTVKVRSVLPWSWSMVDAYKTCPRRFYEINLCKNYTEPTSQEILWGNTVHKALELRIGQNIQLTEATITYEPIASAFANAPGDKYCELKTAVNFTLEPCDFFADDCWNRGVEDLVIVNGDKALTVDWKTGKKKPYSRQLELSACRVMSLFPAVNTVTSAFSWLQTKEWTRATYQREQLSALWEGFYQDVQDMLWSEQNNTWPAKPSGLCRKSKRPGSTWGGCIVASCPHSEFYRGNK